MNESNKFVYFLRPKGMQGPVKIGCSNFPEGRLSNFMSWSPFALEIAARCAGGHDLEKRLHSLFSESHSHGEWFHTSARLSALIDALARGQSIDDLIDTRSKFKKFDTRGALFHNEERRLLMSYRMRVTHAYRPYWSKDGSVSKYAPADISEILSRWSGHGNQPKKRPTPQEFDRLEEAIRNPERYAASWDQLRSA